MAAPKTWEELEKMFAEREKREKPKIYLDFFEDEDENEEPYDPETDPFKDILKIFPKKES